VTSVTILLIRITLYAGADMYSLGVSNLGAVETEGRSTIAKLLI